MDKKCLKCGKLMLGVTKRRFSCSVKCRPSTYVPKGRKRGKFVKCVYCGKKLWACPRYKKRNWRRFCSREHNILYMKKNAFHMNCKICGKVFYCQPSQIKYRNRKTCSRKCSSIYRKKQTEKRHIEQGYTKHQLDRLARYSTEAIQWRKDVFERDNYTCQFCGIRGAKLEADHIKPFAYFPELRYKLSNGRTLCRKCHDKTKIPASKMKELYG